MRIEYCIIITDKASPYVDKLHDQNPTHSVIKKKKRSTVPPRSARAYTRQVSIYMDTTKRADKHQRVLEISKGHTDTTENKNIRLSIFSYVTYAKVYKMLNKKMLQKKVKTCCVRYL